MRLKEWIESEMHEDGETGKREKTEGNGWQRLKHSKKGNQSLCQTTNWVVCGQPLQYLKHFSSGF